MPARGKQAAGNLKCPWPVACWPHHNYPTQASAEPQALRPAVGEPRRQMHRSRSVCSLTPGNVAVALLPTQSQDWKGRSWARAPASPSEPSCWGERMVLGRAHLCSAHRPERQAPKPCQTTMGHSVLGNGSFGEGVKWEAHRGWKFPHLVEGSVRGSEVTLSNECKGVDQMKPSVQRRNSSVAATRSRSRPDRSSNHRYLNPGVRSTRWMSQVPTAP